MEFAVWHTKCKSNDFPLFQRLFTLWAPPSRVWTFENRMRNCRNAFSVVPLFAGITFSAPERRKLFVRIIPWHSAFTDYMDLLNKFGLSVSLLLDFREREGVKKAHVEAVEKMSSHCCTFPSCIAALYWLEKLMYCCMLSLDSTILQGCGTGSPFKLVFILEILRSGLAAEGRTPLK